MQYIATGSPDPGVHNLFSDINAKRHSENRRKVAALYSMTSILQYEWCTTECINKFVTKLTEMSSERQPVDMQLWLQYLAFDLIGMITVRVALHNLSRADIFPSFRNASAS